MVHSLRRNLLPLPKDLPLCAALDLLSRQNPVLDLNCIRQRCLSRPIYTAMSPGMAFCHADTWTVLLVGTEDQNQGGGNGGSLETQRAGTETNPILPVTSPETIQKSPQGQGELAASTLLAAENPEWGSCLASSPEPLPPWKQQPQHIFMASSKLFSSEMIKGSCSSDLSQLQCLRTAELSNCLDWESVRNWRKGKKNTFSLLTYEYKAS